MDAAVDTTAEFTDDAFADVESGLAAAAKVLQANGPAAALRVWTALAEHFPQDPRIFRQAIPSFVSERAWAEAERVASAAMATFEHDTAFAAAWAEIAHRRRDWAEALRRWVKCERAFDGTRRASSVRPPPYAKWVGAKRRKPCSSGPWGYFPRKRVR